MDDRPTGRLHGFDPVLATQKYALAVNGINGPPLFQRSVFKFLTRFGGENPSIIYQYVQTSVLLCHAVHHLYPIGWDTHIMLQKLHGIDCVDDRFASGRILISHGYDCAFYSQALGNGSTDSVTTARHDGNFVVYTT